jgi:hypothetical protein
MTIPVKNLTRLNTEDLERLVAAAQQAVAEFNLNKQTSARAKEFEFTIYTGAGVEKNRSYNSVKRTYEYKTTKRYIGRSQWSDEGRISVLPPDRMFDSPLQMLALSGETQPVIPDEALKALFMAVAQRFERQYRNGVTFEPDPVALGISVRIEGQVAARRTDDDARAMRLQKAQGRVKDAGYYSRDGLNRLRRAINIMRGAKAHLIRGDKGMEAPHADAIQAAMNNLEAVLAVHQVGFEAELSQLITEIADNRRNNA